MSTMSELAHDRRPLVPRAIGVASLMLGGWMGVAVQLLQARVATAWEWGGVLGGLSVWWLVGVHGRAVLGRRRPRMWAGRHGPEGPPRRRVMLGVLWWWGLGVMLGWAVTDGRASQRLAVSIATALEGQPLQVEGVIVDLPQWSADGVRFGFQLEAAWREARSGERGEAVDVALLARRVQLSWSVPPWSRAGGAKVPDELRAGQRWRLPVRLRRPHGLMNPWGFDRELRLFEDGWRATGSVRTGRRAHAERLQDRACCLLPQWREHVRRALLSELGSGTHAGVLAALALGDQGAIDGDDWDLFRRTGVSHLMAISGLHLTMLAWLVAQVAGMCWSRSRRAALRWPAPAVGQWAGLLAALAYAVLTGWGVPAQRTVLMLAMVWASRGLGLRWPGPWVLGWAGSAVIALDPWAMLQPGFWLSFAAVGLLMWAGSGARTAGQPEGWRGRWNEAWRTQWVATVGLLPWTALWFQQVSVVGLLANLVAVPWVTLVVTPLALVGVGAPIAWHAADAALAVLDPLLNTLAAWPWASVSLAVAPDWARWSGLVGGAWVIAPLPVRLRALGWVGMLPMLWPFVPAPAPGTFDLVALDIGQGSAALVRTAHHQLLYDTGPVWGSESDAGDRVLVPYLRALGVGPLDALVLSHRDTDHTGGARSVMAETGVRHHFSALESGHPLRALAPHQPCADGLSWMWDGVRFEFLHPSAAALETSPERPDFKPNALSCVLRIGTSPDAALLAGDIEREQELTMSELKEQQLRSAVLLVPHHGSRTSSSTALLKAVSPHWAVIQAGFGNRYGHPAAEVVDRYLDEGVSIVRSDHCGAWHWNGANRSGRCERELRRRYWHDPWKAPPEGRGPEVANTHGSTQNADQP